MRSQNGRRITVLGGGSWGIALSVLLNSKGHRVRTWEFAAERAEAMKSERENREMLPGIGIPEAILITSDVEEASQECDILLFVVPSHALRETARKVVPFLKKNETAVIATKGIEEGTLKRMSEIAQEVMDITPEKVAVLVGPSHAEEVSRGLPTTVVSASSSEETAGMIQNVFMTPRFRVYTNTDVVGVEIGVALKNVVAIAAGICDGLGYGDNTKGALLTRGLAEITRLGVRMGAKEVTFAGLAGIGDLITTCISRHSRNRYVGQELGKGRTLQDILSGMVMVAEGVRTTKSAVGLAKKYEVETPIASEVYRILFEDKPVKQAITDLMLRSPKPEVWW
jgi:glycerol-3-phosphate dehydrogenase (NAD(P)+)